MPTAEQHTPANGKQATAESGGVVLKAAFLGDNSTGARWWLSLLRQSPGIDLLFLWAAKREVAESLNRSLEPSSFDASRVAWSEGGSSQNRKHIKSLAQSKAFQSFIICLPPEQQADMLEAIFSLPEGREKNIFSCSPPTFNSARMQRLWEQQQQQQQAAGVWSVCSSFIHEVAAAKTKAILLDLGELVAAQVCSSSLLQNQAVAECGNAAALLKEGKLAELLKGGSCSVVSLLRELFGEVASLSCVQTGNAGTLAARLHFEKGPCVSLLIDMRSPQTSFDLVAWGIKGNTKMRWDGERKAFEVHRFLQHYEHPTLHPVTGPTYALKEWARAVVGNTLEKTHQTLPCCASKFLLDLSVANAMLESGGNNVTLKMVDDDLKRPEKSANPQEQLCA
ncbi:hypothetical protein Efla_004644 [Eimeria flavescens]